MLKLTSAKVTASPAGSSWVQIHCFSPSELEKVQDKGQLFIVVASDNGNEGVEAVSIEREIVGKLREEYYSSVQEKPLDSLKGAVKKTIDLHAKQVSNLELSCCVFVNNVVYVSAFGGVKVVINRGGALATILDSGNEVIAASGFPKEGDIILAGTGAFFQKIGFSELVTGSNSDSAEAIAEKLTTHLYEGEKSGTAGVLVMKFEKDLPVEQISDSEVFSESATDNSEQPGAGLPPPIEVKSENFQSGISLSNKISAFFSKLPGRIPKRNIYIKPTFQDEAVSHSRKLTFSVGIILLIVLLVSIGFGIRQKKLNDKKEQYQALLTEANTEVDQAISLASVDPDESRRLFLDSEEKLTKILELKVDDAEVTNLQKKVEESRAAVLGEFVATPELFLDLGLLSSGFSGEEISFSGGYMYVLDKDGARVVSVAMDTKKSKVVAGPTVIGNSLHIASYEDNVFALLPDGVYLVGNNKTKVIDKTWEGEVLIHAFAGNLYILDKTAGQIYRYSGQSGNTFGSQQNWLSSSTNASFANAADWGMNGAIYVLYPNSKILKYSLGSPQNFSLKGISPEIGNVDAIYADPDNNFVYLLDKAGKRVVAIDKNGEYKAQYLNDQISGAIGLAVSESAGKIILLTGEKLLSVELKGI